MTGSLYLARFGSIGVIVSFIPFLRSLTPPSQGKRRPNALPCTSHAVDGITLHYYYVCLVFVVAVVWLLSLIQRKFLDTARGVVNCERDLLYSTGPRGMDSPGGFNK